jgi:hypothetical protein
VDRIIQNTFVSAFKIIQTTVVVISEVGNGTQNEVILDISDIDKDRGVMIYSKCVQEENS